MPAATPAPSASRPAEIHISSLIVRHAPDRMEAVRATLSAMPGLEWCAAEDGKAVVTLVTASAGEVADRMTALDAVPGVLGTSMVYHHCEPADVPDTA